MIMMVSIHDQIIMQTMHLCKIILLSFTYIYQHIGVSIQFRVSQFDHNDEFLVTIKFTQRGYRAL